MAHYNFAGRLPSGVQVTNATLIVSIYGFASGTHNARISTYPSETVFSNYQQVWTNVGSGSVYFDNLNYQSTSNTRKTSSTLTSAVQSALSTGHINIGLLSLNEGANETYATVVVNLEVTYVPKVAITVVNSFGGGLVKVDGSNVNSGTTFEWNCNSSHVIESFNQTWNNQTYNTLNTWTNTTISQDFNQNPLTIAATSDATYRANFGSSLNITVSNSFGGGFLNVDGVSYPSGTVHSWQSGSQHSLLAVNQQFGNYFRVFNSWSTPGGGTNTANPLPVAPTQNGNYVAVMPRQFDVSVAAASYIEGGSGGTYKVNGTNVGASWSGTFVEGQATPILLEAVPPSEYVFAYWSDYSVDRYTNPRNLTPTDHTTLCAIFKKHLFTSSSIGSATNNQRKIAQGNEFYMTYQSGDRIWFSHSPDGVSWSGDFPVSDGSVGALNAYPTVVAQGDIANVVWQSIDWSGTPDFSTGYIYLRRYNLSNNTWGPVEQIANFLPGSQDYAATPTIDAASLSSNGSNDIKRMAWKDPYGIKVIDNNYGSWGSIETVYGTDGNSYYPSIANYNGDIYALCWADVYHGIIRYTECSYIASTDDWSFNNSVQVSPYGWYSNQRPSLAIGYGDGGCTSRKVTIAWQSVDNVVEGVSVHVRGGNFGCNNWGNITSFSMPIGGAHPHPTVGSFDVTNEMRLVWNVGNDVYAAYGEGEKWDAPYLLATGTDGGTECNITATVPSQLAALWRKPNGQIAVSINAGLSAGDGPLSMTGEPVRFRRNRHGMVRLNQALGHGNGRIDGMMAFEIARMTLTSSRRIDTLEFSEVAATNKSLLSSKPFRVAANTTLNFAGAAYGKRLAVPRDSMRTVNQRIARVVLRQRGSSAVRKEIWTIPFSDIASMRDSTYGTFRSFDVDLNDIIGRDVYVDVEMIGHGRIEPLIDDDYLIMPRNIPGSPNGSPLGKFAEKTIPKTYGLYQNYPNPFNPSTIIKFDLPENQIVSLKVFNVLGEEVMTLVNGLREAGEHSISADFTNLPTGMYIYRMTAGKFSDVKKLLLVK